MLQGSTPVQLAQLDISPAIRAGALEQQGIQQMASGLQTAILEFSQKQEEKRVKRERDAQIDSFLPSLLQQTGLQIQPGTPEYNSLASYIKKNSGDDILAGIKGLQDLMPEQPELSSKEIRYNQIKGSNPMLDDAIINDIINDNFETEKDGRGNATGFITSLTTGRRIDLRNPQNITVEDDSVPGAPSGPSDPAPGPVVDDEFVFDTYVDPDMNREGLYGQLNVLINRNDLPTGAGQAVTQAIDDFISSQFGDSPIEVDPDIRAYKKNVSNYLNFLASALRTNPKFSVTEQGDIVRQLESAAKGLELGTFTSSKNVLSEFESLNNRFKREIRRLTNLLQSPDIDQRTAANLRTMLSALEESVKVLGVDTYRGKKVGTMDTKGGREFFDNIDDLD